jgi:hypothetical protein
VDAERATYEVEPICRVLQIAPSSYYAHKQAEADPSRRSRRRQRDEALRARIRDVHREHHEVYGVRKIWHQLRREGERVARCTVARLMRAEGLRGVVRGGRVRTTQPADDPAATAQDLVQRPFTAERPNQLWLTDVTYVATWRGFVYVAFVIAAFSRRIVGWRAHTTMKTELVLDALEQALYDRETDGRLVCHSACYQEVVKTDRWRRRPRWRPIEWDIRARPARGAHRATSGQWVEGSEEGQADVRGSAQGATAASERPGTVGRPTPLSSGTGALQSVVTCS